MKHIIFMLCIFSSCAIFAQSTIIGTTTYDLPTNGAAKNRLRVYEDGRVSAVWTGSFSTNESFTDRGTFYNFYNGTSWGPAPTGRIEPVRTGFPEILTVGSHEVIVTHDATLSKIRLYKNGSIGSNVFTELSGSLAINGIWAASYCPDGTNDIYIINPDSNTPTKINFSRSDNGGNSWAVLNSTIPFLDAAHGIEGLSSDSYQIAVRGNDVYVLYGNSAGDLKLIHSFYKGNPGTWDETIILDFPINNFSGALGEISDSNGDGIADTINTNDRSLKMLVSNDGTVHIWAGHYRLLDTDPEDEGWKYFGISSGIYYWNSTMVEPNLLDVIIDWDNTDGLNDPYAGIGSQLGIYFLTALTSMCGAAIDESTGRLYLIYTMPVEYTDWFGDPTENGAESFRDLFGIYSDDNGATWSSPVNLTNTADIHQENVYPFLYEKVVGGKIYTIWIQDQEPGNSFFLYDPIYTNNIRFQTFTAEDFGAPVACDIISPPTGLFVDGITATSATLHWNAVPGADKYQVMINNIAVPADKFKKKPGTNSVTVGMLTPGSTYSCKVKTICPGGGMSPYSPAVLFSTPLRYGELHKFEIDPNPNYGVFNISMDGFDIVNTQFRIYNTLGELVFQNTTQLNNNIATINLQGSAPGIYFIKVSDGIRSETKKFIIQ